MRSGSVRSGHQTVSDYTLRQWFPNTQQSRCFLTACRRLEKLVLPSIFDSKSFILDGVNLVELSNNGFEWKNVTFYLGMAKYCDPPIYFQGIKTPIPRIYASGDSKVIRPEPRISRRKNIILLNVNAQPARYPAMVLMFLWKSLRWFSTHIRFFTHSQ